MKKNLFFFFIFFSTFLFGQLDREHWFAPMVDRVSYPITPNFQSIYLSTGETTPFKVDIYYNNAVVATFTISKNKPQRYIIPSSQRNRIIINPDRAAPATGLFQPVAMGFYLKGEKPFFASLRFSIQNHAEIQTSKGTAALGKEFRVVMAPITHYSSSNNFMTSVMATEDNTSVTISEFQPNVVFSDQTPRTTINFKLNKGQSYIVDGDDDNYDNWTGFIGSKIVSDKPVVIANGNFNGQYAITAGISDILMDQSVPINKLGRQFVLVKGNGANSFMYYGSPTTMEKAIIVAVKNNTKVFLNGNTTASAILNEGEFFTTPPDSYVDQGSGHHNMYIETSEDAYVYQLLAGLDDDDLTAATGGFNYIPPLSCYLPKKIDEIGKIDENQYISNNVPNGSLTLPTKLNVITEKGATITIKSNGNLLPITALNGPYNVSGNSNWVTYSFPNISGNIAITSTKAVTAGITAGNDAVGYGGFFAGFSSIPMITKIEGECLPDDVKLAVIEGFDHYQWLMKVGNTYVNAPVTTRHPSNTDYFYFPPQAGIYAVRIQTGSCPALQTDDYKFFNCTTYTNYNYKVCSDVVITPKFALTTQTIDNSTVTLTEPPKKGVVTINNTDPTNTATYGQVFYKANKNATGIDTFKFSFCGIGAISDCEVIQATTEINQVISNDVELHECNTTNNAVFNLTNAAVTPDLTATKKYFRDSSLLSQIPNSQITNFPAVDGDVVYVHIKNTFGCEDVAKITLKTDKPAIVNENLYIKLHCDEDLDGIIDGNYKVNVNTITPIIVPTVAGFTIKYYDTEAKANIGGTDNISGIFTFKNDNTPIWIRVNPNNACAPTIKKILLKIGAKISINAVVSDFACDNDLNDETSINLADYISLFTTESNISVKYYDDFTKAQNGKTNENISSTQVITKDQIYYFRIRKSGSCDNIGTLNLEFRQPKKSTKLVDQKICPEETTTLDAGLGFDYYKWSTGQEGTTRSSISGIAIGEYWVDLTSNGCVYRQHVSVTSVELPQIVRVDIQGSTVTINVTGGNPPYQYALDNFNYQSSNTFLNVPGGVHTVYVISKDNCIPISQEITVIQLYNVITPNYDGVNDVLDYSGLLQKEEPSLQIFNRYGTLIFTGTRNNLYSWDGKFSGRSVSTGSYWYVIQWKEPGSQVFSKYNGWVLVKNRD